MKLGEIVVAALAGIALYLQSVPALFAVLFLLGVQSTFFGPLKYAILPQHLDASELVGGNAVVQMGTFVAILLGTIAGGIVGGLSDVSLWLTVFVVAVAMAGYVACRQIPVAAPAQTSDHGWNPAKETWRLLVLARERKAVFLSILGVSWFWLLGSVVLAQIPDLVRSFPTRPVRATCDALPVVFLHRHLQPCLDPAQHPPITHATGDGLEQFSMRNLAKVIRQVRVHYLPVAYIDQSVHLIDCIKRTSPRSVGVLLRWQVRFDDRRQNQHRRRLRHPVPDAGNAQWSELPAPLLRNENPPYCFRPVGPRLQVPRQLSKPPAHPVRLDVRHRLAIDPAGPAVTADRLPSRGQYIGTPHLVAQ